MSNKYQYEKILTTLSKQDFSKSSFENLFDGVEFADISEEHDKKKKKFVDDNILVSLMNYESDSYGLFKSNVHDTFLDVLTYDMGQYAENAKSLTGTVCTTTDPITGESIVDPVCQNHAKNFHPFSFLNRINYYLCFIQHKIKSIDVHLHDFFLPVAIDNDGNQVYNGKCFSLNSCPTYPLVMQQTLTLSQFDSLAVRTQNVMLTFIRDSIENAFLGKVPPDADNQTFTSVGEYYRTKMTDDPDFFKRNYYDMDYTLVKDDAADADTGIKISDFLKYVIPSEIKDTYIADDFYLQLQMTSKQSMTSIFTIPNFDDSLYDWKSDSIVDIENIRKYYSKNTIELADVIFFLSLFIEKLSHIKSFSIIWKHLKNTVETEFHAMSTLTLNYESEDGEISPNHALYITTIISPVQKRQTTVVDDNSQIYIDDEDNFDTNILLVNSTNGSDSDIANDNLFDNLIYDNEEEDVGNIDDEIKPDIGQFFNTNGIFGAQYFVQRKNNFTLTVADVQKQFNLYSGQIISRKSVLNAIDYIFNIWTANMSTYTLQIVTCHSNCHANFAVIQKSITGTLNLTRTVTASSYLSRDYCYCGSVLTNTMTIKVDVPDYILRDYNITSIEWQPSVSLAATSGTLNYNTRPGVMQASIKYDTDTSFSDTKSLNDGDFGPVSFTIPGGRRASITKILVKINDVDSACGVSEKEYNTHWRYTKNYRITGKYTIKGTLKTAAS